MLHNKERTQQTIYYTLLLFVGPKQNVQRKFELLQPGAVKLVLCGRWMHLSYMHQWRQRTNFIAPGCILKVGSTCSTPYCCHGLPWVHHTVAIGYHAIKHVQHKRWKNNKRTLGPRREQLKALWERIWELCGHYTLLQPKHIGRLWATYEGPVCHIWGFYNEWGRKCFRKHNIRATHRVFFYFQTCGTFFKHMGPFLNICASSETHGAFREHDLCFLSAVSCMFIFSKVTCVSFFVQACIMTTIERRLWTPARHGGVACCCCSFSSPWVKGTGKRLQRGLSSLWNCLGLRRSATLITDWPMHKVFFTRWVLCLCFAGDWKMVGAVLQCHGMCNCAVEEFVEKKYRCEQQNFLFQCVWQ